MHRILRRLCRRRPLAACCAVLGLAVLVMHGPPVARAFWYTLDPPTQRAFHEAWSDPVDIAARALAVGAALCGVAVSLPLALARRP